MKLARSGDESRLVTSRRATGGVFQVRCPSSSSTPCAYGAVDSPPASAPPADPGPRPSGSSVTPAPPRQPRAPADVGSACDDPPKGISASPFGFVTCRPTTGRREKPPRLPHLINRFWDIPERPLVRKHCYLRPSYAAWCRFLPRFFLRRFHRPIHGTFTFFPDQVSDVRHWPSLRTIRTFEREPNGDRRSSRPSTVSWTRSLTQESY